MGGGLGVVQVKPAVVTIDLQKRHLDEVATLPLGEAETSRLLHMGLEYPSHLLLPVIPS